MAVLAYMLFNVRREPLPHMRALFQQKHRFLLSDEHPVRDPLPSTGDSTLSTQPRRILGHASPRDPTDELDVPITFIILYVRALYVLYI